MNSQRHNENAFAVARVDTPGEHDSDMEDCDSRQQPAELSIGPFTPEEESHMIQDRAAKVGGRIDLNAISLGSNCKNLADIVETVNAGKDSPATEAFIGELVPEGHIAFASKNGILTAVGPGRYLLPHPRAEWVATERLAGQTHIQHGPITIVRVPPGHYGRAFLSNEPVLLRCEDGGLFAFNNPTFRFVDTVKIETKIIKHATVTVVRVPRGMYACVVESNKPAFLPAGVYVFKSEDFEVEKVVSLSDDSIQFRTLARFFVPKGTIGLAWRDSVPVFFQERGIYLVDSPMFRFVGSEDIENPCITHGSKKIVTVKEGLVGVSHDRGVLKVLQPGRWTIESEGHLFDEFLSTQQQCLSLSKDDTHKDLMVCETRELVRIGIQASVFYNIKDPKLAVVKIGERSAIERFINETATAVITTIIRSTSLAEIAQQSSAKQQARQRKLQQQAQANNNEDDAPPASNKDEDFAPNAPFFDRMHSDFISRLQKNFLEEYGIYMLNMRIGDFKVIDKEIAQSISNHVSTMAETQAKLANLEGKRQIELVNKDAAAQLERIQAQVDAQKVEMDAKSKADASTQKARAAAEAKTIEAETNLKNKDAEARIAQIEAEVEAKKIELQAKAKAEAATQSARAAAEAKTIEAETNLKNKDAEVAISKMQAEAEARKIEVDAKARAEAATQKARAEAEAKTIEADTALKNKDAEVNIARINAEIQANQIATKTKAEAAARLEAARANAEAMRLEAEAKAASIKMIAEAEAEATRCRAAAEAERASKLGQVDFGREVTLAEINADMVKGSLNGVNKVVYLPTELQKNPFALFGQKGMAGAMGDN